MRLRRFAAPAAIPRRGFGCPRWTGAPEQKKADIATPGAPCRKPQPGSMGGSRLYESLSTLLGIRACLGTGQVARILKSAVRSPAVFSGMLSASAGPAFDGL